MPDKMGSLVLPQEENSTLSELQQIQTQAPPDIQNLSKAETIYDIDLNARTIDAPYMLSVAKDHKASVIYFRVDRYYDYMDLAETICLVQYVPPGQKQNEKRRFTYIVPFFDIMKEEDEGKLIFPWVVSGKAAESEGDIQFAVCFYKIDDTNLDDPKLVYNLNTMPAKSRIVHGIQASNEPLMNLDHEEADDVYEWQNIISQLSDKQTTQWRILT